MKVSVSTLRARLAEMLDLVEYQQEPIEIQKHGKTVAVILSTRETRRLIDRMAVRASMIPPMSRPPRPEPDIKTFEELRAKLGLDRDDEGEE